MQHSHTYRDAHKKGVGTVHIYTHKWTSGLYEMRLISRGVREAFVGDELVVAQQHMHHNTAVQGRLNRNRLIDGLYFICSWE